LLSWQIVIDPNDTSTLFIFAVFQGVSHHGLANASRPASRALQSSMGAAVLAHTSGRFFGEASSSVPQGEYALSTKA
jgi:hypothetical protein